MDIKEAVKSKENYIKIVAYFRDQMPLKAAALLDLIDMVDEVSPEIYEHYRALQDIFRAEVRRLQKETLDGEEQKALAEAIARGCANGTLLREKYEEN